MNPTAQRLDELLVDSGRFLFELTEEDTRELAEGRVPAGMSSYARVLLARAEKNRNRGITVVEPRPRPWDQHALVQHCKEEHLAHCDDPRCWCGNFQATTDAPSGRGLAALLGDAPAAASENGSTVDASDELGSDGVPVAAPTDDRSAEAAQ